MNTTVHEESRRGFTISEVMLAVGIVAFGLVAVFSILPFGLTAQKDNREETIVRYEAEYWFAVLQAGGQPLEALDRVETIELKDAAGSEYRVNRYDLLDAAKAGWSVDVCGWLSAPKAKVPGKFARVRSINGSLFDRLYSPRGRSGYFLGGGEFSFGYFLETQVEPHGDSGSRITLTFHWPITEAVENALRPKSPTNPGGGKRIESIVNNPQTRLANRKSFSINTNLRSRPALSYVNLDARQSQFMRAGLPGDEVSIGDLQAIFPDRKSLAPWDGIPRQLVLNAAGDVTVMIWNQQDNAWKTYQELFKLGNPIIAKLSDTFHWNDAGLFLHIDGQGVAHSISNVHPNGHYLTLTPTPNVPFNRTPVQADYKVSFLKPSETWEDVLSDYQRFGLVEKRHDKYRINSIYNSDALGALTNSAGQTFRIPLKDADYWPARAPLSDRNCSFWFLK